MLSRIASPLLNFLRDHRSLRMRGRTDVDVTMKQLHKKLQRLLALGPRIRSSLRRRGLKSFMRRATVKIAGRLGRDIANPYLDWVEDHTPSASALAAQRRYAHTTPDLPRFTLVLRSDAEMRTNPSRTLRSLRRQTYCHWSTVHFAALRPMPPR